MRCPNLKWNSCILVLVFWFSLQPGKVFSQSEDTYDEISLVLNVQRVGSLEIPAIIYKQDAYLPIKDIFDFLKIKNTLSGDMDVVSGYLLNPQTPFVIDKEKNMITYAGHKYPVQPGDMIKTETNLYLRSDYFGDVFGLICSFNFRNLTVSLTTKLELPVIREMQQELVRKNIFRLRGEKKADTVIKRNFSMFKLGVADWAVTANQQTNSKPLTRVNFNIGAALLGGEANVYLNYVANQPFNKKQQFYNWRYVNNSNRLVKQVLLGKIFPQATTSIFSPMTGFQVSNTPTSYRRSYGTYTLSNKTEPGWLVELYINNVLVNFMKADASGFYTFEIPMIYGSSEVKLRFYGPWGEERTSEQFINIPFNFIPQNQLEYAVTGGIVDDDAKSRFASAKLNYGISRHFTIGGGVEYLSTANNGKPMPYINASVRLGNRILLSGEKMYQVKTGGAISYRSPSRLQVDFNYTKYNPEQTAVKYNYLEDKKLVISKPFRGKKYSLFTRVTLHEITLLKSKFTSGEMLVSFVKGRVSSNLTTYAIVSEKKPLVFTNLSASFYLPGGLRVTPQVQYEYRSKNFSMLRGEVEKNIFKKGYVNASYQKSLVTDVQVISIGLRYNFSFAQTFFSASNGNNINTTTQSARGSLLYDKTSGYFGATDQTNMGRGGIIVRPYLDLNCNGERDLEEPNAPGLNLRVNGGRIENNKRDSSIRITGLEAYNSYFIELDKNSFDNVAWQIRNQTIGVEVDPNQFKLVEVPVAVMGEVAGSVTLKQGDASKGIGRIIINITNARGKHIAKVMTESDGYFSFIGLPPGNYIAAVDAAQLQKLHMGIVTNNRSFKIKVNRDGDIVDGLDFKIIKLTEGK